MHHMTILNWVGKCADHYIVAVLVIKIFTNQVQFIEWTYKHNAFVLFN